MAEQRAVNSKVVGSNPAGAANGSACTTPGYGIKASNGFVAQLVRAPPCHGGGRGFKSHRSR
jgi:hypothetical protein